MDTPLVPSEGGKKVLAMQIGGGVLAVFVLVVVVIMFITGAAPAGNGAGWFFIVTAMLMLMASTGFLVQRVVIEDLEDPKYAYLIGFQATALVVMAIGALVVIYAPEELLLGGTISNSPAGVTLKYNDEVVNVKGGGQCSSFILGMQDINSDYEVSIVTNPTKKLCRFGGKTKGTITKTDPDPYGLVGNTGLSITCQDTYYLGGSVTLTQAVPTDGTVILSNGRDTVLLTSSGKNTFTFPTAMLAGTSYSITYEPTATVTCTFTPSTSNVGTMGAEDITNISIACDVVKS